MSGSAKSRKICVNSCEDKISCNKWNYYIYHASIAKSFEKDCETFLLTYKECKDLSFKTFCEVWHELHFNLIFAGEQYVHNRKLFTESCFFTIKKYFMFSEDIYVQVGAFYMLFGVYNKQLPTDNVRIRLNTSEYLTLLTVVNKMDEKQVPEVGYLFRKMKCDHVLQFVMTPCTWGIEAKDVWHEKSLRNDIFQSIKKFDPVKTVMEILYQDDFYGLQDLANVSEEYTAKLKKLGFSSPATRETFISQDLQAALSKLRDLPENKDDQTSSVNTRRRRIKKKAFSTEIPSRSGKLESESKTTE